MDPVLMIMILIIALVVWWYIRQRQPGEKTRAKSTTRLRPSKSTAYHAVAIKFSKQGCSEAKALAGTRFLATEAPTLPLPNCKVNDCDCHFTHYDDRRLRNDRRSPFATSISTDGTGSYKKERRDRKDRRADDDDFES